MAIILNTMNKPYRLCVAASEKINYTIQFSPNLPVIIDDSTILEMIKRHPLIKVLFETKKFILLDDGKIFLRAEDREMVKDPIPLDNAEIKSSDDTMFLNSEKYRKETKNDFSSKILSAAISRKEKKGNQTKEEAKQ